MEKSNYNNTYSVINVRTVVWDLLSQWKAILIVALLAAIAVSGLKYVKDMHSYNSAVQAAAEAEENASISVDERIENILSALSDDDRLTAEYVIQQKSWIREQKDYLNNSILQNVDPTNQRTLLLDYLVTCGEDVDLTTAVYSYLGYIYDAKIIDAIGDVLSPESDSKYIAELISYDSQKYSMINHDADSIVVEIEVVLPEDIDKTVVEKIITDKLVGYSDAIVKSVGKSSIKLIRAEDTHLNNVNAISQKNSILTNIYNMQNTYLKNIESSLSDEAKSAVASIEKIQNTEDEMKEADEEGAPIVDEIAAPGFSKKYALLGFILGCCLYAFVYLLNIIMKGCLSSPGEISLYTGSRLFGEIYYNGEYKGLQTIFHSKIVDRLRYKDKLDCKQQLARITDSIEAACRHNEADQITLICVPEANDSIRSAVDEISATLKNNNVSVDVLGIEESPEDKEIMSANNVIYVASKNSKIGEVNRLVELLREYSVKQIGSVYVQQY